MLKIKNNTGARCEICSELTINTPERRSGVFIVNFEHISNLFLVFINFEQVNASWVSIQL